MANYGKNFTDELRERLSIVDVVGRRVPLTKKGAHYWGCCPFHNEKTPSFSVREDWGKYHCFGCGESGDIISFVMKTENLEFKEALLELAQMAGLKMPDYKPKSPEQAARESSYLEIVEAATKIYQQKLYEESGADALRYIRGRGFSEETIKKYRIGYAPRGSVITAKFSGQKLANLIATGLVRSGDNGSYDFFRDKLMFPITNAKGEVIAFSGRSMDGSEPKYINTADTELFHKRGTIFGLSFARDAIHRNNRSIIVEGQIDAIQMQTHGFPETVAPLGTALTEDHLAIIAKHNRNIIFCFDGDGAGQKAAARACGLCMALMRDNSEIKFAFVSGGKDPDEILRGGPDGTANMKKIIDGAAPLAEFLWELANKNYLVSTPGGRAQAEKFLKSEIEKITDPLLKNEFTKEYDQRKFNQWHKWKKADGMGHKTNNPVPEVDSLTKKTLSYIIETFPELAEKHYEFLQKFGAAETGASAGFMTAESAEKFIVSLKLKCYLESLQNERNELLKNALLGENSGVERINVIDAEIKKSRERLELVVGDSG